MMDGRRAVGIVFGAVVAERLNVPWGVAQYFPRVAVERSRVGVGYLASRITGTVDDPQIEITLSTILRTGAIC